MLQIIPIDRRYYGAYKCRAKNIHGEAEHEILLREAHPPSEILQAKREVITGEFCFSYAHKDINYSP
jgi:hypothetical protein